jgi:hypothetical protein
MAEYSEPTDTVFGQLKLKTILSTYNPWWLGQIDRLETPVFRRDAFAAAVRHLQASHDLAFLINGPRRVGKTTVMRQLVKHLIEEQGVAPQRVLFFSLDDPFIQQRPAAEQGAAFEDVLRVWEERLGSSLSATDETVYCFLDEIQRLPHWELYVKRYVDLRYRVRFVISGSASHTIFRKSLESLLGRVVEVSLPPFAFREWLRFHRPDFAAALASFADARLDIRDRTSLVTELVGLWTAMGRPEQSKLTAEVDAYAKAGGFPQLWGMKDAVERSQFIDSQFVQRVTMEDLRLVKEIRNPEVFHRFLRHAFARTGDEYELNGLTRTIGTSRNTLVEALPLLLQTDLLWRVERFSGNPVRLRTTHAKLYATDPVLYEAVIKTPADLMGEDKGRLTETLVFNVLRRLPGISDISYFRAPKRRGYPEREVDFVVRIGRNCLPIEVKSRSSAGAADKVNTEFFLDEYGNKDDYGILVNRDVLNTDNRVLEIPLGLFLLLI